jgi:cyclic pyranopterin phosphate synthase
MVKAVDKAAVISDVRVLAKSGGRSGTWTRPGTPPPEADA